MSLSSSWTANQNDVLSLVEKLASMQLAHHCLVHFAVAEVKARQVPVCRKPGQLHLVSHGPHFTLRGFGFEQLGKNRLSGLERRGALISQLGYSLGHAVHFESF
jgi:hypothetical protein